ncbi:hypothetical protein [Streptomyces sp. NPDC090445]|uniref:hypothetical protein n=1 Tax=Streptomyces sp. NPDC090445 TaxID=3365963 RepID=UPI00380A1269
MGDVRRVDRAAPPRQRPEPTARWSASTGVGFTPHTAWADLREALSDVAPDPEFTVTDQGGFLEYRAEASCVSVLVVDDEEEERGYRVGHGDVWSVSLWAPVRAD